LGLGLSIVKRLAGLLGHNLTVHSRAGQGSVFAIEVELAPYEVGSDVGSQVHVIDKTIARNTSRAGQILVVEDDPEVRDLIEILLKDEGYVTAAAPDGAEALALVERGTIRPDLILADYNLPNGMDGLAVAASLRRYLHREIPVIILTGDISTETLRSIALQECIHLNKPVKLKEVTQAIRRLLSIPREVTKPQVKHLSLAATSLETPTIFIVDDDALVREGISAVLEQDGRRVKAYSSCEAFFKDYRSGEAACLLIDAYLPGMSGLELLQKLHDTGNRLPAIMITGNSDVPMAVQAMKAGASDFVEKPIGHRELLTIIDRALEQSRDINKLSAWRATAANHIAILTPRQREIMQMVLAGHPSKNIAADLGISQRTVENHRASIMKKTGSKSLPALARLAMAAADVQTG
jgi:two-component system CheB/CheR fusion protein